MAKKKVKLPSTVVGRRRLLKLADLLEADAKNKKGIRFDLGTWGWAENTNNPVSCGTTACAMGLAVASGAFTRAGLLPPGSNGKLIPRVGKAMGFQAAQKLFHIKDDEADYLFSDSSYPLHIPTTEAAGERAVAKRIRRFVVGKISSPQ
jgi:hypothetical protein